MAVLLYKLGKVETPRQKGSYLKLIQAESGKQRQRGIFSKSKSDRGQLAKAEQ